MKYLNLFLTSLLIFACFTIIPSCSKDEDKCAVTLNGAPYQLNKGYYTLTETNSNCSLYEFKYFSSGITVSNGDATGGTGSFLVMTFCSNTENGVADGNYVFNNQFVDGNFFYAGFTANYDYDATSQDTQIITGGSVDVSNGGANISVNLNTSNSKTITGCVSTSLTQF